MSSETQEAPGAPTAPDPDDTPSHRGDIPFSLGAPPILRGNAPGSFAVTSSGIHIASAPVGGIPTSAVAVAITICITNFLADVTPVPTGNAPIGI